MASKYYTAYSPQGMVIRTLFAQQQ